jgi:hypothetical protein
MRITSPERPDDKIIVDLIKPSTLSPDGWLKPLEFEITQPPTLYVRMPHGQFAVRVISSSQAEVKVSVDGASVLQAQVGKGVHVFDKDAEGRLFNFSNTPAAANVQPTLFDNDEQAECTQTHGEVAIQVRFCDVGSSSDKSEFMDPIYFQMNAPGDHEEALASLLSKMKAPPKLTAADDIFGDHDGVEMTPHRHCCNCGHDH